MFDWENAIALDTMQGNKNLPANVGDTRLIPRSGRSPEERNGNSPGKSYGQRSLVGYSSWQGVGHD